MQLKADLDYMRMTPEQRGSILTGYVEAVNSQGTDSERKFPSQTPLGMAYVPFQAWGDLYEADQAFPIGTVFKELDHPFLGGNVTNE